MKSSQTAVGIWVALTAVLGVLAYKAAVVVSIWNGFLSPLGIPELKLSNALGLFFVIGVTQAGNLKGLTQAIEFKNGEEVIAEFLYQIIVVTGLLVVSHVIQWILW